MATKGQMLWIIENYTFVNWKCSRQRTPHFRDVLMTRCLCVRKKMKERSSLFSFFMTKAHSIPTMVKGGFGLKLESKPIRPKG